jgi:hypothetical protein
MHNGRKYQTWHTSEPELAGSLEHLGAGPDRNTTSVQNRGPYET